MVESSGEIPREKKERAGWGKRRKTNSEVCIFSGSRYSVVYIGKAFHFCQSESSKKVLLFESNLAKKTTCYEGM